MRYFDFVKRCLFSCIVLASSIQMMAQSNTVEWTHLSTLWDAPGTIMEISPRGDYAVIEDNDISRLVEILSGKIILEVDNGYINFSPQGQYVRYSQYSYEPPYTSNILNLKTLDSYQIEADSVKLMVDDKSMITTKYTEDQSNVWSQIRNIETGEVVTEYFGSISRFSRDESLLVLHINEETQRIFRVIDIASGRQLAEYTYPMADGVYSFNSAFNVDDSLLSLYFFPEEMQVIDTSTWEVLYTLSGGITFSRDGNYIAHNNHAGYSEVQLIEAHTGKVLDEFLGELSFSSDARYLIRGEAINYDLRNWQIIDIDTEEVVFQQEIHLSYPEIYDNEIVSMFDYVTQSTRVYDLTTGDLINEIVGGVEFFENYILVDETTTPFSYIKNLDATTTYVTGRQITMIPNKGLALVSNGLFVDVYGLVGTGVDGMPPPRSTEGVVKVSIGKIFVYKVPNSDTVRIIEDGNMLNHTYFNVLGRTEDYQWVFVSFLSYGRNPEWVHGWVRNYGLQEITQWHEVPILETDDPIAELQSIAFSLYSE